MTFTLHITIIKVHGNLLHNVYLNCTHHCLFNLVVNSNCACTPTAKRENEILNQICDTTALAHVLNIHFRAHASYSGSSLNHCVLIHLTVKSAH